MVTTINKIPTEWGFAGSFAPIMLFMGTFISSMVSSVLLAGSHAVSRARGTTAWVNAGLQVVYGAAAALLIGFGVALSALTMLLGTTLSIPRQFLPTFWSEWIYPWIPARFAGQGARDILYAGEAWLNSNTGAFFRMVAIGLTLIAVAAFKNRTPKELVA
ncbi:MAG: hypothetical protein Q4A03_09950 [Rothia sp. (in: high G+C Gram-positive bacteria)]|uniref:hypothetical protein n=1 Tax=Rothia sp. (in: high G+C Gram-positive bacteria) TaxID=1885016 RepID=UPI00270D31EA|nr:hypothetical protein [Rothia sp. (in: high G+C Gram-positive bacteria)]